MLAEKLAGSGVADKLYVDDVFSTYLYTGNGSTQTINNGVDLAGKGGLVWIKYRNTTASHALIDTERGRKILSSDSTTAQYATVSASTDLVSFNSDGFTLGANEGAAANGAGWSVSSWTFRKAPKFFDVVTYTGDGASNKKVAHSLGITPGMVIIKDVNQSSDWAVWHRGNQGTVPGVTEFALNSTKAGVTGSNYVTATTFYAGQIRASSIGDTNASDVTYVAYLFAHDPSADGIIQCGSFTTDGSGNATVNLGWEPQYLMVKRSNAGGGWIMFDTFRDWSRTTSNFFTANTLGAEVVYANTDTYPTATGFVTGANVTNASSTFVYLAIRRPNKPPTSGTQVYNAIARTGTGTATTVTGVGFAPDLVLSEDRNNATTVYSGLFDKLRGANKPLHTQLTSNEATVSSSLLNWGSDGVSLGADGAGNSCTINYQTGNYVNWFFRRAPGFFDVVCYTGTGAARTVPHGLGVVPELMMYKCRSASAGWFVHVPALGTNDVLQLNTTSQAFDYSLSNPTATAFYVSGAGTGLNDSSANYVAYLFASLPGISKIGNYTGNGSSQTINCGFSTGARFILIKRTNSTGDWFVWDSVRGIVAANDPHLSLNTNAAEVTTDDSVDPDNSGFVVNQVAATNINVTSASYIFLAIA